jgi:hypothetical protein
MTRISTRKRRFRVRRVTVALPGWQPGGRTVALPVAGFGREKRSGPAGLDADVSCERLGVPAAVRKGQKNYEHNFGNVAMEM